MKGRSITGIVVSVLLILALLLVFTDPWDTLGGEGKSLLLKNSHEVDRIVLSGINDSTELVRAGKNWTLFGVETANPVPVENVIFAAGNVRINSVESDFQPEPGTHPTRVEFYRENKLLLVWECTTSQGRFLVKVPGSTKAYYLSLPGFAELDLSRVFTSTPNHYREHIVIDLKPSEIARIEVLEEEGSGYGFIQDQGGNLSGFLIREGETVEWPIGDELAVRLLLSYFTDIRYEERTPVSVSSFTSSGGVPSGFLEVTSRAGDIHRIGVYPYRPPGGEAPHLFKALVTYNNLPDVLLVNYIYLDVLMRDRAHYFALRE